MSDLATTDLPAPEPADPPAGPLLRPMRPGEDVAVRRIFLQTIALGRPTGLRDDQLAGYVDLCLGWYLEHGEVTVVEVDGGVHGYLLACLDERANRRWATTRALRWGLWSLLGIATGRLRGDVRRFAWRRVRDGWTSWRQAPPPVYPAHAHVNLDPHVRDGAVGHRLAAHMDARVAAAGLAGWYGELNVPEGGSLAAIERAGAVVVHRQHSHTFSWLLGTRVERATIVRPLATRTDSVERRARPAMRAAS